MRHALLVLGLAVSAAAPAAVPEATGWLTQVSEAARTSNYKGVVVYREGDRVETMQVTHRFQSGEECERLVSLSGEAREILRHNDRVTTVLPLQKRLIEDRQAGKGLFPVMSQDMVVGLSQHYNFRELGTARVAGRNCQGMHITPQDGYRYGYEICADEERKVPLRVSLIDRHGRVLEQMMFTELSFPVSISDAAVRSELDTTGFTRVAQPVSAPSGGNTAWVLQKLPPGFRLRTRDLRTLPGARGTVEHLLLSDGLSTVSVYSSTQEAPARGLRGMSRMGGVNAYDRMVGPFHVTVVGEVPPQTVQQIGDGLQAPTE